MAVVFISPKQKQKMFFRGITLVFLLLVILISFLVLLAKPKQVSPLLVFNKTKVDIDMKIFDSEQFKSLQLFSEMQMQFTYTAVDKKNKQINGFIAAVSEDEARKVLEATGLTVSSIKEIEIGRDNPFEPYYQITAPVYTGTKTNTKTSTTPTTSKAKK